jgi:hypothetical protein
MFSIEPIAFFQTEQIGQIIETINDNIRGIPAGEIVWASLGAFVPQCIFAAPVMTEYLQNACVNANRLVAPFSRQGDGGHYLPGQWVPHAALSVKLYSCSIGNSDRNLRSDRGNEYY